MLLNIDRMPKQVTNKCKTGTQTLAELIQLPSAMVSNLVKSPWISDFRKIFFSQTSDIKKSNITRLLNNNVN